MRLPIVMMLMLAGCATTPEDAWLEPVNATYSSAKPPMDIARCLKDLMPGLDVYPGESEVSVSSKNQLGAIIMNWRIIPTDAGSTIELRKNNSVAPGEARATRCY